MTTIDIDLPPPHPGQIAAYEARSRYTALCCGRRWGKTQLAITILVEHVAQGQSWGLFAPDYKILSETYRDLETTLSPIIESASRLDGVIRTISGGRIDFWTLNNPRAGRSRKYHGVIIDEAAFAGDDMPDLWSKAIKPTLLDYRGVAWALSTPNGMDQENWFYQICEGENSEFTMFRAPTSSNPFLPADEIERLRETNIPDVFRQEYLAEFVDWSGSAFFSQDLFLVGGEPVDVPDKCDVVFCTIDTAVKTGTENDGTAVVFYALNNYTTIKLYVLDWEILQIEGSLLDAWLPSVFERLEQWSRQTGARMGVAGAWIEDKASGSILLQQAMRRGFPVEPIDNALTAVGKDERAISVSSYHHQGLCKMTAPAYHKTTLYKGISRNHFLSQVCGFRIGVKNQKDDLLDCHCYALAGSLGDGTWF